MKKIHNYYDRKKNKIHSNNRFEDLKGVMYTVLEDALAAIGHILVSAVIPIPLIAVSFFQQHQAAKFYLNLNDEDER